jgi:integrase
MTQGRATPKRSQREGIRYIPFSRYDALVAELRQTIRVGSWHDRRDALAVVLGLHGLRVGEVCQLTVHDLDAADEVLSVKTLKRGRPRRIELGVGVCREIVSWRAGALVDPLLFTLTGRRVHWSQFQRFVRAVTKSVQQWDSVGSAQPSDCFHALRHTYAMRLLHATGNTALVMGRLGHRNLTSTQEYIGEYGQLGDRQLAAIGNGIAVVPALAEAEPVSYIKLFAG